MLITFVVIDIFFVIPALNGCQGAGVSLPSLIAFRPQHSRPTMLLPQISGIHTFLIPTVVYAVCDACSWRIFAAFFSCAAFDSSGQDFSIFFFSRIDFQLLLYSLLTLMLFIPCPRGIVPLKHPTPLCQQCFSGTVPTFFLPT